MYLWYIGSVHKKLSYSFTDSDERSFTVSLFTIMVLSMYYYQST